MVYILMIIAIVGILSLNFIKDGIISEIVNIKDVKYHLGGSVRIEGSIVNLYKTKQGHTMFTVSDDDKEKIKAVIFKGSVDLDPYISLEGKKVDVIGKVDEYNDELDIIVNKIKIL